MAIHLNAFGNTSISFGGTWNNQTLPAVAWGNPLAGLRELTVAITLTPDSPFTGGVNIFHNASSAPYQSTFQLFRATNDLGFRVINGEIDYDALTFLTTDAPLQVNQTARIVGRWKASTGAMSVWVNGQPRLGTIIVSGTHGVSRLTNGSSPAGEPIEVGAVSNDDVEGVFGTYSDAAIWGIALHNLWVYRYGIGYSPALLPNTNRIRYARLTSYTNFIPSGEDGIDVADLVPPEEWANAGGRVHQAFSLATHPNVIYNFPTPLHVNLPLTDYADLPQRRFERYELEGNVGKRTGTKLRVPSDFSISGAMATAKYGDDIILDHTQTFTQGLVFPDANTKTITTTTPRMPPTGQKMISGGSRIS